MNIDRSEIPIQWWEWHRRLYQWVQAFARSTYAMTALFLISVIEASLFPIAPDILQIAMTLENPQRAWRYATITTTGSVLGGLVGYALGALAWHYLSPFFYHYIFSEEQFLYVSTLYHSWGFWAVVTAAFTPIPYKIFTISAGVFHYPLALFLVASLFGRAARFFLVAALLNHYGSKIKFFIERYFNLLSILFVLLFLSGVWILQLL